MRKSIPFFLFLSLLLFACSPLIQKPLDNANQIEEPILVKPEVPKVIFVDPVEINPPNTNYLPAFEGQTRITGVETSTPYTSTILTTDLHEPWGIDVLPHGDLVVTEKSGKLRIVKRDGTMSQVITGFPTINSSGQGGLLDVTVSPHFSQDRMLYFTFSLTSPKGSLTAVGKAQLSVDQSTLNSFEIIYEAIPHFTGSGHYGSRIVFDQAGYLFVSTGDRQSVETRINSQNLNNGHGKILRITTEGMPAQDNPFINQANTHAPIYAYGVRNVQGLAINPITGDLWASEMGPLGGDEVNLIQSSKNYGWPIISYGKEYNGSPIGSGISQKDGMMQPVYYWDPAVAPSGMIFYTSNVIPEWSNNLFIATLRGQHIVRLVIKDNLLIGEERLLSDKGQRFRDLAMGLQGELYAITDQGRLYRIGK